MLLTKSCESAVDLLKNRRDDLSNWLIKSYLTKRNTPVFICQAMSLPLTTFLLFSVGLASRSFSAFYKINLLRSTSFARSPTRSRTSSAEI
jgi:hypothetical protein